MSEIKNYIVGVTRIGYSTKHIEVQATCIEEAEAKAKEEAGNLVFTEQNAEYETASVQEK